MGTPVMLSRRPEGSMTIWGTVEAFPYVPGVASVVADMYLAFPK